MLKVILYFFMFLMTYQKQGEGPLKLQDLNPNHREFRDEHGVCKTPVVSFIEGKGWTMWQRRWPGLYLESWTSVLKIAVSQKLCRMLTLFSFNIDHIGYATGVMQIGPIAEAPLNTELHTKKLYINLLSTKPVFHVSGSKMTCPKQMTTT